MNPWHWLQHRMQRTGSGQSGKPPADPDQQALDSLKSLLQDQSIPAAARRELSAEYRQLQRLLDKLESGQLHIAAVGRVSSGKSSLLNALLGETVFATDVRHGHTRDVAAHHWSRHQGQSLLVLDTPGSDDANASGPTRERLALAEAQLADVVLFVTDGDLTASQLHTLRQVVQPGKPLVLVLNKSDLYTDAERDALLASLRHKTAGLVEPRYVVSASADPRPQTIMHEGPDGQWRESRETPAADTGAVREAIWHILESRGDSLRALNASLFAGRVSDRIAEAVTRLRAEVAEKIITTHALTKAVAVAFNPVPVADLLLAGGIDISMIRKLSRAYGLPLSRGDAARLGLTISAQLAALMGAVWGINLASAALKTVSAGLSVTLTAAAQGSLAYYASYLIGKIAQDYFRRGRSWGPDGPKTVAARLLKQLDRQAILEQARNDILRQLKQR